MLSNLREILSEEGPKSLFDARLLMDLSLCDNLLLGGGPLLGFVRVAREGDLRSSRLDGDDVCHRFSSVCLGELLELFERSVRVLVDQLLRLAHDVLREETSKESGRELGVGRQLVQKGVERGRSHEGLRRTIVLEETSTIFRPFTVGLRDKLTEELVRIHGRSFSTIHDCDLGRKWRTLKLHIHELTLAQVEVELLLDLLAEEVRVLDVDGLHFSCFPFEKWRR
nr:MAG TPA: hypothetical protein [Caudoviricetes sp.]